MASVVAENYSHKKTTPTRASTTTRLPLATNYQYLTGELYLSQLKYRGIGQRAAKQKWKSIQGYSFVYYTTCDAEMRLRKVMRR